MSKAKRTYAVLGLGSFGSSMAMALEEEGIEVLAIDDDLERVNAMAPYVTCALQLDVTNENGLKNLGIEKMDGAVVSIGENLEASVMATILVKEMGVPMVMAKAENELHKTILLKVGADRVVFPEKEMGERLAKMISGNFRDYFRLSNTIGMVDVDVKPEWVGKSLIELDFRNKYQVNIIAIRRNHEVIFVKASDQLQSTDQIIAVGEQIHLDKLL